jgi:hypothetical protein
LPQLSDQNGFARGGRAYDECFFGHVRLEVIVVNGPVDPLDSLYGGGQ